MERFEGDKRWYMLHRCALDGNSHKLQIVFEYVCTSLDDDCYDKIDPFLADNPLPTDDMWNILYNWTYDLHDYVNKKLGKISPKREVTLRMYLSKPYCHNNLQII